MSEAVRIEPVTSKKDLKAFVEFPFTRYRGDPCWVPPFIEERLDFLNPQKNPFFDHARYQLFLARRGAQLVGTIGAVVDEQYNQYQGEQAAVFGFFETIDDPDVAASLLEAAEAWGRAQEMEIIRGPMSFSTNHELGLLIEGFDEPPMVMMTYNPRSYAALIEAQGYSKAMDLFAYIGDLDVDYRNAPPKVFRIAEKAARKEGIHVRKGDIRHFEEEIARVKEIYDQAWVRNWGFVPFTAREIEYVAASLKPLIDPDLVFIAETEAGRPIGISVSLPDLHQALRWSGGGHMWPLGLPKFLWQRRKIDQVRLWAMGVVQEYRLRGVDAIFYVETARAARAKGYKRMEGSWILETNTMMNRIIEQLGGQRYKTYRIYEKLLQFVY